MTDYNIYCDESCYTLTDHEPVMVLGATWCPQSVVATVNREIRNIKEKFGISPRFEIKWVKISPAKEDFYLELIDYFFNNEDLHFRGVVIPDKEGLNHEAFGQKHDDWYYKMFYFLLRMLIKTEHKYFIYLDKKDTRSGQKKDKLWEVLSNAVYDFERDIIKRVQHARSRHEGIMQITDLLIGGIMYANRGKFNSAAKTNIVRRIKERSGHDLLVSTARTEVKFNIFRWTPAEV